MIGWNWVATAIIVGIVILSVDFAYLCSTVPNDIIPCLLTVEKIPNI